MINREPRISTNDAADTRALDASDPSRGPYRQVPTDFIERWPQFGWSAAKEEWRAHSRTIARWVDECGRCEMVLARKRYLEGERSVASRARRKRYVLGRTLTPVGNRKPAADAVSAEEGQKN